MKKVLVIYNLTAGMRRRSRLLKVIKKKLPRSEFDLHFLNFETFLASDDVHKKFDYDVVVIAGGDGTIRRIVSFLQKNSLQIPIGIVPIGSANVLAQSLHIPLRIKAALDIIQSGIVEEIDLGCINREHYFLEAFAMGYISERILDAGTTIKSLFGFGGYLVSFLRSRKISQFLFKFSVDGKEYHRRGSSLLIVNTQRLFGFEPKRPNDLRDGFFELTLATSKTFKEFFSAAYQYFFHDRPSKYMFFTEGRKFSVSNMQHTLIQVDGDLLRLDDEILNIEILAKRVKVICHKKFNEQTS